MVHSLLQALVLIFLLPQTLLTTPDPSPIWRQVALIPFLIFMSA